MLCKLNEICGVARPSLSFPASSIESKTLSPSGGSGELSVFRNRLK